MRAYNSIISVKKKPCVRCGVPSFIFSRGRCQQCSKIEDTLAKEEKEVEQEDGLPELIAELDTLISRYVRLKYANKDGLIPCYTCDKLGEFNVRQAGHYIPRGCMLLRFDVDRNIRPQCETCNCHKRGNIAEFGKRLEAEMPNVTEILLEESRIIYKYTRDELKQMIAEYSLKLKSLKH